MSKAKKIDFEKELLSFNEQMIGKMNGYTEIPNDLSTLPKIERLTLFFKIAVEQHKSLIFSNLDLNADPEKNVALNLMNYLAKNLADGSQDDEEKINALILAAKNLAQVSEERNFIINKTDLKKGDNITIGGFEYEVGEHVAVDKIFKCTRKSDNKSFILKKERIFPDASNLLSPAYAFHENQMFKRFGGKLKDGSPEYEHIIGCEGSGYYFAQDEMLYSVVILEICEESLNQKLAKFKGSFAKQMTNLIIGIDDTANVNGLQKLVAASPSRLKRLGGNLEKLKEEFTELCKKAKSKKELLTEEEAIKVAKFLGKLLNTSDINLQTTDGDDKKLKVINDIRTKLIESKSAKFKDPESDAEEYAKRRELLIGKTPRQFLDAIKSIHKINF